MKIKRFISELILCAALATLWLPLFVKRSFWEEWGVGINGEGWVNSGIESLPATFWEAWNSRYNTWAYDVCNILLLSLYAVILALILDILVTQVFRKRAKK